MSLYFFTRSYTYDEDAVATIETGTAVTGHEATYANDYDKNSYCEIVDAAPEISVDLGTARTVDSLWFKSDNIDTYEIYYSSDGSAWTLEGTEQTGNTDGANYWIGFTSRSYRYWKIKVTGKTGAGNVKFYEIMFMELRLTISDKLYFPKLMVEFEDTAGGGYVLADGSWTSYSGEQVYAKIEMTWDVPTPKANRDNLYTLYSTPTVRPMMVIIPDIDNYPDGAFQVVWDQQEFGLTYGMAYKGAGFSGSLKFREAASSFVTV